MPCLSTGSCHSIDLSYMTFTSNGRPASPQSWGKMCPFSHLLDVCSSRRRGHADLPTSWAFYTPFIIICTLQDVKPSEDPSCAFYISSVCDVQELLCSEGLKFKFLMSLFPPMPSNKPQRSECVNLFVCSKMQVMMTEKIEVCL